MRDRGDEGNKGSNSRNRGLLFFFITGKVSSSSSSSVLDQVEGEGGGGWSKDFVSLSYCAFMLNS